MDKEELLNISDRKCKIIDIKNNKISTNVVVGTTIYFYFLVLAFIVCVFLNAYFIIKQTYINVVFISALLLLIVVALGREKQVLFLKISYPQKGIMRVNSYNLNYEKNDVMVYVVGIQTKAHYYDYRLNILEGEEIIYSVPINYVRQKKILQFIDNLIFDDDTK